LANVKSNSTALNIQQETENSVRIDSRFDIEKQMPCWGGGCGGRSARARARGGKGKGKDRQTETVDRRKDIIQQHYAL